MSKKENIIEQQYCEDSIIVSIDIEYRSYQFLFTLTQKDVLYKFKNKGVKKGYWCGLKLRPIAPLLYKYSCYLLTCNSTQMMPVKSFF